MRNELTAQLFVFYKKFIARDYAMSLLSTYR
jgi:hypothetical protein